MTDVLIYADTLRSPEMRHEVPLPVPDPFLYAEVGGTRYALAHALEVPRLRELDGIETVPYEDVGWDELIAAGISRDELHLHLAVNACGRLGIESAVVPSTFPVELADHLRAGGIELRADRALFADRRRAKTPVEVEGIRRAQRAAETAMDAVRAALRRADASNSTLVLDGEPLTCERLKRAIGEVFAEHDVVADDYVVSHGSQSAVGHDMGSGPIAPGEPIVGDLWPKDRATACYADMTRTFVVGDPPPEELAGWHRLVLEALQEAIAAIRPGAGGRDLYFGTCDLFERHGHRTARSKAPGEVLEEGFFHGLGHGVGLEVHEDPGMGLASQGELVAGDVVTVEPGLYRPGFGGCRLEDIVLVTESGAENLTDYPYDLTP